MTPIWSCWFEREGQRVLFHTIFRLYVGLSPRGARWQLDGGLLRHKFTV